MSFQVRSLLLYRSDGEVRVLRFEPASLNVITGASKTGKSSIIAIIDYCLASNGFGVAAGVIRDSVAMYAVVVGVEGGQQVLLARPRPPGRQATTTAMHLRVGDFTTSVPNLPALQPNTDAAAVRAYLSELVGIEENRLEPTSGARLALTANIRHALFFVFQGQGEVANPDVLFHSQAEEWVPQAMRDTLPYFLGAVDREHILKRQRLRTLARELRQLRRDLDEEASLVGTTATSAALVVEAVAAGLVELRQQPRSQSEALSLLASAVGTPDEPTMALPDEDQYLQLLDERADLRRRLGNLQAELRLLTHVASERSEFESEANEQAARLVSLELVPGDSDGSSVCPVCTSRLETPVPTVDDLREALAGLSNEIAAVRTGEPRIQAFRGDLEARISEVKELVRRNALATRELESSRQAVAAFRDEAVRRAAVRGRISLYLETARQQVAKGAVIERVSELESEIAILEEDLAAARTEEALESALSRINRAISTIAVRLGLEHSESPIRLDVRHLTVVADTPTGAVSLSSMGSGENWLGYHVAALLALHDWFIDEGRPVPRFLVLDQPSQVYFPPDSSGNEELPPGDEDRAALARVMNELLGAIARNHPRFQIIVLDHADLQEPWFQAAVVERWRDGQALIPASWLDT